MPSYVKQYFPFLFLSFLLPFWWGISCCGGRDTTALSGDTIPMLHSSLLTIVECDEYTVADVRNPWSGSHSRRYLLLPRGAELPTGMPEGIVVRTPIESAVLFSGVHATLFEELDAADCIAGVCDAEYLYCDAVQKGLENGAVVDCGSSLDVNMEKVFQVKSDALLVLPYENGGYGKLENIKVPIIECADYMESSPLGCAEWIRFYARLIGKAERGDSLFAAICGDYERVKALAESAVERPLLMCELKSSSAWYVPGGKSTMGQLYADAGACYLFADNENSGSLPLAYEVVLEKAANADVWFFKYNAPVDKTYSSLLADFAGYAHFRPFKEKRVYSCNTARKRIFEATSFHPERLLKEFVAILHPEALPGYKPVYYEELSE